MALTVDRPDWTAAQLNTFWTALVEAVRGQISRGDYETVNGWTISEADAVASGLQTPNDLVAMMTAKLFANSFATCVRVPRASGNGDYRIVIFEYGTRTRYRYTDRESGVQFPIRGWFDVIAGSPYTVSTSGDWTDFSFGSAEDLMGFTGDVEAMLNRLNERGPVAAVITTLAAHTASGSGVGKYLQANANGAIASMDGISLAVGDRVLYAPSGGHADSGIYTVTALGSGSAPWKLTRATDLDASSTLHTGVRCYVTGGTIYGKKTMQLTNTGTITLESTALTWGEVAQGIGSKSRSVTGAETLTVADFGKVLLITMGTFSLALPTAAAAAGLGMICLRTLAGAGTVTIDPDGAETIDGSATVSMSQNSNRWIWSDGSAWYTLN